MGVSGTYQGEKMAPLFAGRIIYKVPAAPAVNVLKGATNITTLTQSLTPTTQPVMPRNVTLTMVDTTPSLTGGTITVVGIDQNGKSVSEVHTYSVAGLYTGAVAFASVKSVNCALTGTFTGAGDETMAIGVGDIFGLPVGINGKLEEVFKFMHADADVAVVPASIDRVNGTYNVPNAQVSNADHDQGFLYTYKSRVPLE